MASFEYTQFGYVFPGFRPTINPFIEYSGQEASFSPLGIEGKGTPAPMPDAKLKAAVWLGRSVSGRGESPVLAMVLGADTPVDFEKLLFESIWWYGAAKVGWDQGEFGMFGSELALADFAIERAMHGTEVFGSVVVNLKEFLPDLTT